MAKERKRGVGQIFLRIAFLLYVAAMAWLLFGQRWGGTFYRSVNLKPLVTIKLYWDLLHGDNAYLVRHAFINLAGNVIMFVPLGYFLPKIFEKLRAFWKTTLFSLCLIITVEAVQFFTMLGTCDVDDLILNMVGVILGYLLWRIFRR